MLGDKRHNEVMLAKGLKSAILFRTHIATRDEDKCLTINDLVKEGIPFGISEEGKRTCREVYGRTTTRKDVERAINQLIEDGRLIAHTTSINPKTPLHVRVSGGSFRNCPDQLSEPVGASTLGAISSDDMLRDLFNGKMGDWR